MYILAAANARAAAPSAGSCMFCRNSKLFLENIDSFPQFESGSLTIFVVDENVFVMLNLINIRLSKGKNNTAMIVTRKDRG